MNTKKTRRRGRRRGSRANKKTMIPLTRGRSDDIIAMKNRMEHRMMIEAITAAISYIIYHISYIIYMAISHRQSEIMGMQIEAEIRRKRYR